MVVGYNTVVVWNALKFPGEQALRISGKDVMRLAISHSCGVDALKFIGEQALRVSGKYVMRLAKVTVVVWIALKFPGEETVSGEDVMRLDSLVINRSNTNSIPAGLPSLFFCGCVWVGVCVLYVWVGECCGCGWVVWVGGVFIYHISSVHLSFEEYVCGFIMWFDITL